MDTQELSEEQVNWLQSANGRWFWGWIAEMERQYMGDACRTAPTRPKRGAVEDYHYFRLSKDVAAGRAAMCGDMVAMANQIIAANKK